MELATLVSLVVLNIVAAYALWRGGHAILRGRRHGAWKLGALSGLAVLLTAAAVLVEFLLVLGLVKGCLRYVAPEFPAACENLSPMHVVFVFTLFLPLLSLTQLLWWLLRGRPRGPIEKEAGEGASRERKA